MSFFSPQRHEGAQRRALFVKKKLGFFSENKTPLQIIRENREKFSRLQRKNRVSPIDLLFLTGLLGLGVFLLAGCTAPTLPPHPTQEPTFFSLGAKTPTPFLPQRATSTIAPSATFTKTSTPIPTPTNPPSPDEDEPISISSSRPQYILHAELDYDDRLLKVEEKIVYTNQTGVPLDKLLLIVEANRYHNCFSLESLAVNHFKVVAQLKGGILEIPLGVNLESGESITLEFIYKLNIPAKRHEDVFGYLSDYQINIVNWYPFVAPYIADKGWLFYEPSGVGEHLVYESSDFDVSLKVNGGKELIVAASAEGKKNGTETQYKLEEARTFVFSVSPHFGSLGQPSENMNVTSFFYQNYEFAGEGILKAAVKAISIYSDRYAPYPYESLSIVQTDLADGMEYDGLIFMGSKFYDEYDGTIKNNLVMLGVHEVSHQWWFGSVGSDTAQEPWLDEALALYSERIFYETAYPFPVNWWWRFRVRWFNPTGWVDTTIYDGYDFRGYTNAVYLRGGLFLEDLRVRIGEKAFNSFLQDYASSYAGKIATSDDFFATLDKNTDEDYSDLLEIYFK